MTTYRAAGVDVAAGDRAVELMKTAVARTNRPEVIGGLGGFAGLFRLDLARYREPVLATSADGVGTKIAIARAVDRHDTIGIDLVAMVVDDLVVVGAEPLFLTDYIATGKVVPERIAAIVAGVSAGCVQAGCALLGGETAEHPGVMPADDYDISGSGVGVVEAGSILGAQRVAVGDALIAMAASGLHSNGYSLVRRVLFEQAGLPLDATPDELAGRTLADELLEPTRIYARDCLRLIEATDVHAFAHITGGGLAANLARILPPGVVGTVDRATWSLPGVFALLDRVGELTEPAAEVAFNRGVGMVAVVAGADADRAVAQLRGDGVAAWQVGTVDRADDTAAPGTVAMRGRHHT